MPKVSVIMGIYNADALASLDRAIGSVLGQTVDDLEFVICDDGSDDGTYERMQAYAERDPRIRLLRNGQNMGLAAALNRCIAEARGKFLARQDADDISAPDRLEKQLAFLEEHPQAAFVGSNVTLYDASGPWGSRRFPLWPEKKDLLFAMPFVHGALMFRREALEAAGGYRSEKKTLRVEDYDLILRMYSSGMRGANIQEALYLFLEDEGSLRRRRYRYRLNEAAVRWEGFCKLDLMPGALPYVIKPLLVGLLPRGLLFRLKDGRSIQIEQPRTWYGGRDKSSESERPR